MNSLLNASEIWQKTGLYSPEITAKDFFYSALRDHKKLANITFEYVDIDIKARSQKVSDSFDIVMYGDVSVAIITVKELWKDESDLIKLQTQKVDNFRLLFPRYKDHKIVLGIGGFSVPKDIEVQAREEGLAILRQKGEVAVIEDDGLKVY